MRLRWLVMAGCLTLGVLAFRAPGDVQTELPGAPVGVAAEVPPPPQALLDGTEVQHVARPAAQAPAEIWDLCGVGRMPRPTHAAGLPAALDGDALREARLSMWRTLAQGDARQRVAAWLLQRPEIDDPALLGDWAAGLMRQALAERDPQGLRWAAAACAQMPEPSTCRRELVRVRVQLEPDNALHWLEWAQEEPDAAEQAWQGLAHARYWREYPSTLAAASLAALGPQVPAYVRVQIARDALGYDAALAPPSLDAAAMHCDGAADATHSACDHLARLLAWRSDTLTARGQGLQLGLQLGWSAQLVEPLSHQLHEQHAAMPAWTADPAQPLSCANVDAQLALVARLAHQGEGAPLLPQDPSAPP